MEDELDSSGPSFRSKLRVVLLGGLVLVLVVGSAYTILESVFGVGLLHRPFGREAWAAEDLEQRPRERRRERMVRNLVKRHLALGMPRTEVEALLGPPDPDPTLAARAPGDWIYELGPTVGEMLEFVWWGLTEESGQPEDAATDFEEVTSILKVRALMIGFDAEGRVNRIEIVEV